MQPPTISFVLPVHNAVEYLAAAVQSVLSQTHRDFELIVINDGSTDGSRDVLATFKDDRLRILDQPNSGLVEALNRGVRVSRGEWIARMDADDICLPHRLERQIAHLAVNPHIALLGGYVATIDEQGRPLASVVPFPVTHDELWQSIGRRHWVMCHPAVIFRRQAAIDVGLFDRAYQYAEDTEFFARLMTRYRAENLPEVVLKYRLRQGAMSSQSAYHGRVNAVLVRTIADRWKPGEPFQATPQERAEADARIASGMKKVGPRDAVSAYHRRCGRELLREARWGGAIAAYTRAALATPTRIDIYKGLAAAVLRAGAAPAELRRKAAAVL